MTTTTNGARRRPRASVIAALQASEPFGMLAPAVLRQLATELAPVFVAGGDLVVREGDAANAAYLVVRGRLRATATTGEVDTVIGEIGAGELIGELALVDDRARTASIRAIRDCELLQLSPSTLGRILREQPDALRRVLARIVDRARGLTTATTRPPAGATAVALVPAGRDATACRELARALVGELGRFGRVRAVSSSAVGRALGAGVARSGPNGDGNGEVLAWLHAQETDHRFVVYVADKDSTEWTKRCLRQADRVLLVADATSPPPPSELERAFFAVPAAQRANTELVLVHAPETVLPRGTAAWLADRPVNRHYHVRVGSSADAARLARTIAGRAVGLVLGGGGARGLAHLGVMRALDEAGVPIDAVGGTSIGAIMAAAWAVDLDHEARERRVLDAFVGTRRLVGSTLPIVSMSSSRKLTRMLRRDEHFGDTAIEDLWVPYFCVSANVSRAEAVVHDRGPLWWAVRASIALPGILPPVWADGELLVDGGVVDNLPVATLRARQNGPVVAVDVSPRVDLLVSERYEPDVSGWRVLGRRLHPRRRSCGIPNALEIVMRAKEVGGLAAQRAALASHPPDLLIEPAVASVSSLDFRGARTLVDAGYRAACDALASCGSVLP